MRLCCVFFFFNGTFWIMWFLLLERHRVQKLWYTCIYVHSPYSQNVAVSCSWGLSWEHNSTSGVDGVFALVVSIHDAVGQPSVGAFVSVEGRHSVHCFSLPPSLSLWYFNLVNLLQEDGLVVIFVQDSDHHPGGAVSRIFTTVWHQNLENRIGVEGIQHLELAVGLVESITYLILFYTIYLNSSHHRVTLFNIYWTPLWGHIHLLIYIINWVKRKQLGANSNIPNLPEWKKAEGRRIFYYLPFYPKKYIYKQLENIHNTINIKIFIITTSNDNNNNTNYYK